VFATGTLDELEAWKTRYAAVFAQQQAAFGPPPAPAPGSLEPPKDKGVSEAWKLTAVVLGVAVVVGAGVLYAVRNRPMVNPGGSGY
jgi:hypothetical protein